MWFCLAEPRSDDDHGLINEIDIKLILRALLMVMAQIKASPSVVGGGEVTEREGWWLLLLFEDTTQVMAPANLLRYGFPGDKGAP